jgi:hypothetical protein
MARLFLAFNKAKVNFRTNNEEIFFGKNCQKKIGSSCMNRATRERIDERTNVFYTKKKEKRKKKN